MFVLDLLLMLWLTTFETSTPDAAYAPTDDGQVTMYEGGTGFPPRP